MDVGIRLRKDVVTFCGYSGDLEPDTGPTNEIVRKLKSRPSRAIALGTFTRKEMFVFIAKSHLTDN